jgi:hypothetical protein
MKTIQGRCLGPMDDRGIRTQRNHGEMIGVAKATFSGRLSRTRHSDPVKRLGEVTLTYYRSHNCVQHSRYFDNDFNHVALRSRQIRTRRATGRF